MALTTINNGDTGLAVRTALNSNFSQLSNAGIAATMNSFVWMGDSRMSIQFNDGPKRNKSAAGFMNVANTQLGQRMVTLANYAVAGQRSDQYISSLSAAIALQPRFLCVLGVVNDASQGYTAAQAWANIKTIVDTATAAGIIVIVFTEPGASSMNAGAIAVRNDFNARLYEYAQIKPGLLVFDYAGVVLDPTATSTITFKSNVSYDNVHLTNAGARAVGTAFATFISPFLSGKPLGQPIDGLAHTGTGMLLQNGLFLTTTGGSTVSGITGTQPASWGHGKSGSPTATVTSGAASDGIGNELIFACTAGAANDRIQTTQQVSTGLALNDTVRAMVEVGVDSGAVNLRSVRCYITAWYNGLAVSVVKYDMQPVSTYLNTVTTAYTDMLAPDSMLLDGGATLDRVDMTIAAEFSGAGSATFRVRKAALNKLLAF